MGCKAVNLPHILAKSTAECFRKLWERYRYDRKKTQTPRQPGATVCVQRAGT